MKNWIVLLLVLCFNYQYAQETKKEITIKKATIYLSGAKVFGETNISLVKGRNTVEIINLPNDLNDNTIGISLEKNVTLLSVTPTVNYMQQGEMTDAEKFLDQENKKLQREISLLDIQLKTLNGESNLINSNLKILDNDKFSPQDQLIKLSQFYSKRMLEIDNAVFIIQEKKLELQEKINKIAKQFAENSSHKNHNNKGLILEILAENATSMDLGINYMVQNAGWVPNYDIRAINTKSPLEIIYKGKIYQRTGQDWKNVKLFVSTYLPNYNQNRPVLQTLYVTEYLQNAKDYNEEIKTEQNKKVMSELAMSNAYQMKEKKEDSNIPVATVSEGQMNILYELNNLQSINSQEKEQYVILDKQSVKADYIYHAVPKLSNQVYLLAKIKDWQNLNLISGEANIYFDDNYIGKTQLNSNYTNNDFPVSLGTDERIVIKRQKLQDKSSETNLGSNKKETETYLISIKNNSKQEIELEVLDQVPLSENNKISVKILESDAGEYDPNTGSLFWKKKLATGATSKINFTYEVKYPKESTLQYYNR